MKFKSSILVIICLFVMHTFSVSASDIDFDDIFNSCEYEEIIEYLQNSDYIQKEYPSITAAQFQQGYIFYYADAESFLNSAKTDKCLTVKPSDRHDWIIPTDSNCYFHVFSSNGDMGFAVYNASIGESANNIPVDCYVSKEHIEQTIKAKDSEDLAQKVSPICFYIPDYHTYFVYFTFLDNVYVIPYSFRPDMTGLNNGECYNIYDAVAVLEERFPEINIDSKEYAGGVYTKDNNTNRFAVIEGLILLIVIAVFVVILCRFKRSILVM